MGQEITGPRLAISGALPRHEIVRTVVETFIKTEAPHLGAGAKFRYPVEDLSIGHPLFLVRPAALRKWNFDFKVEVLPTFGMDKGRHSDIVKDFEKKRRENTKAYDDLRRALDKVYLCSESDVDTVLRQYPHLAGSFKSGAKVDVLLKVVKWMFIMEDIVYWNYKGRSKLYDEGLKDI